MSLVDLLSFFNLAETAGSVEKDLHRQCELRNMSERSSRQFAEEVAKLLPAATWVLLVGELGAGKTTWVQWLLHNHDSRAAADSPMFEEAFVSSPTYALVNTYAVPEVLRNRYDEVLHLDLYRIKDMRELFYMGLDAAVSSKSLVIIEWPNILTHDDWQSFFTSSSVPLPQFVLKVTISGSSNCNEEDQWQRRYALDLMSGKNILAAFD